MNKFSKKDCEKKLGLTEEETKIVMKAQNLFPELLTDENDKYINSLRNLYMQLGIDKSNWSRWIKKNVKDNEFFKEDKDWWGFVIVTNGNETMDFKVSIEFAKHLCMTVKNSNGHMIRQYFIIMEKAVKQMSDWLIIRNPQKQGYKEMCEAINTNYKLLHDDKEPNNFIYINNADMINLALMGRKSKDMKKILDIEYKEPLRDNLVAEVNKALYELQQLNSNLLYSNIDFQTRKMIIQNTCTVKYTDIRIRFSSEFFKELHKIDIESKLDK